MKATFLLPTIMLICLFRFSSARLLTTRKEQERLQLKSPAERKLVVVDEYEKRRKEYESAKCKFPRLFNQNIKQTFMSFIFIIANGEQTKSDFTSFFDIL